MLTKKQKELYDFLSKYISENKISPSFEEMKRASASTVKMDSVKHWKVLSERQSARNSGQHD